ncbi:hypothetical protein L3Q82_001935 [Scortum barcoo]|uniref:Uncharacterized protein n=1 Tax=Scortum barcoo TaxID=214431 RepID=A0ACB8W2E6_9TELE|nr:hypothetical protein L3Q82_001935 [Scortum barcoo]
MTAVPEMPAPIRCLTEEGACGERRSHLPAAADKSKQLHCTAYVSQGPDPEYDNEFNLSRSGGFPSFLRFVLVCKQERYLNDAELCSSGCSWWKTPTPTLPCLSKSPSEEWKDLGPFTLKCNSISDWEPTAPLSSLIYGKNLSSHDKDLMTGSHTIAWLSSKYCVLPDLTFLTPLTNPDLILQAELVALTEACKFAAGKTVTIYTDSRLRRLNMDSRILCSFYRCTIESILTGCITAWYSSCTTLNRKALQMVVKAAQHITRMEVPSMEDLYTQRCRRKATKIKLRTPVTPATNCSACCRLADVSAAFKPKPPGSGTASYRRPYDF